MLIVASILLSAASCVRHESAPDDEAAENAGETAAPTNRTAIPPLVQRNLGITFASVEQRHVERMMRLPGRFELRPEALREYHVMLPGRVELLVVQFDRVQPGDALLHVDSPQWRTHQHETVEAAGEIHLAESAVTVAEAHLEETEKAAAFIDGRLAALRDAGVRNVELESQLHALTNQIPRLRADVNAKEVELAEAREHYESGLNVLSAVTGLPVHELLSENEQGVPRWRTIERLTLTAEAAGVVDVVSVTNGGWVETGDLAIVTVDPSIIRFEASALQSDLATFDESMRGRIAPVSSGAQEAVDATILIGLRGKPDQRTIPLYAAPSRLPEWARPGIAAYLDVVLEGSEQAHLAIPQRAVIQDGLEHIFFLRARDNPQEVIRIEADLGASDGRWVVVKSGVRPGDEVVLDGVYELMLAQGERATGGHFHADGTFHAEDH